VLKPSSMMNGPMMNGPMMNGPMMNGAGSGETGFRWG
jgi:hypothetical protein